MDNIHTCHLCLGTNMPPQLRRLDSAINELRRIGEIVAMSDALESDDDTGLGRPYLNIALKLSTPHDREQLLESLSEIETRLGRKLDSKQRGMMPIDIDLVTFDGDIVSNYDFSRPYFKILYSQI